VPSAADPGEAALLDRFDEAREDRRVAGAPDEPWPHDHGLQPIAVGVAHDLLGLCLRRRVERLRVRAQRRILVGVHERLSRQQAGLGADVHEAAHARGPARLDGVAGPLHVHALELRPGAPLAEVRGGMERHVGAVGAAAHGLAVVQVPPHGLGAGLRHLRGRGIGARERTHAPAVADQAPDQAAADEARAAGDERRAVPVAHHGVSLPASLRDQYRVVATPTSSVNAVSRPAAPVRKPVAIRRTMRCCPLLTAAAYPAARAASSAPEASGLPALRAATAARTA
jgi:hypothetical protein